MTDIKGYVNSIQTLGAVDGPGVRFVAFVQGCPLRCACCHNPDTWEIGTGKTFSAKELADKAERYKEYFGKEGGITVSGGEPLLQPEFVTELFKFCHEKRINTCLDTSGCILNDAVKELLKHTDHVLLDIKYTDPEKYSKYVGCSMDAPLKFLEFLESMNIPTRIRQVIIPGLNDTEENITALSEIVHRHKCIKKTEFLPFRKLCQVKYDKLKLEFPLKDTPEPKAEDMKKITDSFNLKKPLV